MLGEAGPPPEPEQITEQLTETVHDHEGHTTFMEWVAENPNVSMAIGGSIAVSGTAIVAALIWAFKRWVANKLPKRASDDD